MPPVDAAPRALARAAAFFPLVGAVLGAAVGGLGLLLAPLLPPAPTVALQLAAVALLTGALHLDGLMDTADGVLGGRTTERRLEIMRDSRVGAFGVVAAGLMLLAQFSCLVELVPIARLIALTLALMLGRWAMAMALGAFPSARSDGLGAAYAETTEAWPTIAATALAIAGAAAVAIAWSSVVDLPQPLVLSVAAGWALAFGGLVAALAVALGGGHWLAGRLGGLTGDTYGALCVVAATAVLYLA
jgi:adenosylcobinamide-GDP ribazoletransferase